MPPAIAAHTVSENPAIVSTIIRVCSVIFLEKLLSSSPIFTDSPATSLEISPRRFTNSAATAVN